MTGPVSPRHRSAAVRLFVVRYCLHNGARGVLAVLARSTCEALISVHDTFDGQVRASSGRPA